MSYVNEQDMNALPTCTLGDTEIGFLDETGELVLCGLGTLSPSETRALALFLARNIKGIKNAG